MKNRTLKKIAQKTGSVAIGGICTDISIDD